MKILSSWMYKSVFRGETQVEDINWQLIMVHLVFKVT